MTFTAQAADRRIFETDSSGNRKYDKPSYTITDNGRIYETDSSGNHKYNGQHFRIDGSRILPTDSSGNRLYNLPSRTISPPKDMGNGSGIRVSLATSVSPTVEPTAHLKQRLSISPNRSSQNSNQRG